jgi:D-lyxose ketol-isomerase
MSQIEHREVIRDDYNIKHYEVILRGGATFVFDYGPRRFLEVEEPAASLKKLQLDGAKERHSAGGELTGLWQNTG